MASTSTSRVLQLLLQHVLDGCAGRLHGVSQKSALNAKRAQTSLQDGQELLATPALEAGPVAHLSSQNL